jgi:uncharacterized membrane protein
MGKDRLAAFSDGVIAIIITIMVLELHVPHGSDASALAAIAPSFLSYVLSFIYVGIYWNNHHHLLHTVTRVDGLILWANLHLLFWLSIIPVTTAWMGQNLSAPLPTAIYGAALLMPAIAYVLLQRAIIHRQGTQSVLAEALGGDLKGKISPILYIAGIVHSSIRGSRLRSMCWSPSSGSCLTSASNGSLDASKRYASGAVWLGCFEPDNLDGCGCHSSTGAARSPG